MFTCESSATSAIVRDKGLHRTKNGIDFKPAVQFESTTQVATVDQRLCRKDSSVAFSPLSRGVGCAFQRGNLYQEGTLWSIVSSPLVLQNFPSDSAEPQGARVLRQRRVCASGDVAELRRIDWLSRQHHPRACLSQAGALASERRTGKQAHLIDMSEANRQSSSFHARVWRQMLKHRNKDTLVAVTVFALSKGTPASLITCRLTARAPKYPVEPDLTGHGCVVVVLPLQQCCSCSGGARLWCGRCRRPLVCDSLPTRL